MNEWMKSKYDMNVFKVCLVNVINFKCFLERKKR